MAETRDSAPRPTSCTDDPDTRRPGAPRYVRVRPLGSGLPPVTLVLGGARSGKSRHAEILVEGQPVYFCCDKCTMKAAEDPAKYAAMAYPD